MTSSILTKSFTNQVKRSSSSSISFSNFGGFLQQTFNSISNNFVNARPTMESSFQNAYLIFSNIRRRIEDLRYSFTKYIPTEDRLRIILNKTILSALFCRGPSRVVLNVDSYCHNLWS